MPAVLRCGGRCYIKDLCQRAPFASRDLEDLHTVVYGITVTSIEDYSGDLHQTGLADILATDTTADWASFVAERLANWRLDHAAYAAVHGEAAWQTQSIHDSGNDGRVR